MLPKTSETKHFKLFVKNYCDGLQTVAAKKLNTYPQKVFKYYHGLALINPAMAAKIEKITKGNIMRHHLRNDLR